MPMTNSVVVDQVAALDLIDQLRVAVPEEIRQAKRINEEIDRDSWSAPRRRPSASSRAPRSRPRSSSRSGS